jgi:tRNA A37 threonylcarbamoyladenosine synthetase subunit TsaC/SUA5/YrdC
MATSETTFRVPGAPNIIADAQRIYAVLRSGGIALCPSDVGYFLATTSTEALTRIFNAKKRAASKRHPMVGTFALHQSLHILSPLQTQIIRCLVIDFALPLAVVAKYRPDHPVIKKMDELERLDTSTAGETIHAAMNVGKLCEELAKLCIADNMPFQGSSANLSGSGNNYRLEDVPKEFRELADIEVDHGLAKWGAAYPGLGATILDFSDEKDIGVVRIGACYDVILDKLKRFFGIELPADPGRASVPHGNMKVLEESDALKRLVEGRNV